MTTSNRKSTCAIDDFKIKFLIDNSKLSEKECIDFLNASHVIGDVKVDGLLMQKSIYNINNKESTYYAFANNKTCNHVKDDGKQCKAIVSKTLDRHFCHNHQPNKLAEKQQKIEEKQIKKNLKEQAKALKQSKNIQEVEEVEEKDDFQIETIQIIDTDDFQIE